MLWNGADQERDCLACNQYRDDTEQEKNQQCGHHQSRASWPVITSVRGTSRHLVRAICPKFGSDRPTVKRRF